MEDAKGIPFQQAEGFYRHLFDSSPDVLMMIDDRGKVQVVNSRCGEVLGYAVGEVEGGRVQDLLALESRSTFDMMLTGVCEGTPMPEGEVDIQARGGLPVPMMLDVRQIEEEGAGHFLLRLRDLREIKGLEQEYRDLFESIADAVFIGDVDSGQIYQANRQACDLTGYALGELMGAEYDRVHSDSWEVIQREVKKGDGGVSGRETSLRTKEGGEVSVEVHLRIVSRGEDWLYIESAIDISARKALEARMRDLRNEWDAFIRHELRSPLTPILAFAQILMEDFPEVQRIPKVPEYLDSIFQGGKRLERLLDLTREVQQYERGEILLHCVQADLYLTLQDAIQDAALGVRDAEARGVDRVRLICHSEGGDLPGLQLRHDSQKLQRALANLVKNALEHDPGEVTVRVADRPEGVGVSVHNRGEPIPEEKLKTIFEKFNTTKRDRKGTGLGTTIAKLFVEAHGGRIEAVSSASEGTTFTVTLPKSGPPE